MGKKKLSHKEIERYYELMTKGVPKEIKDNVSAYYSKLSKEISDKHNELELFLYGIFTAIFAGIFGSYLVYYSINGFMMAPLSAFLLSVASTLALAYFLYKFAFAYSNNKRIIEIFLKWPNRRLIEAEIASLANKERIKLEKQINESKKKLQELSKELDKVKRTKS